MIDEWLGDVAALLERAGSRIDKYSCATNDGIIALAHLPRVGPDKIDMLAIAQPLALNQWCLRERGTRDEIGRCDRSLPGGHGVHRDRATERRWQRSCKCSGKPLGAFRTTAPDHHLADRPDLGVNT